MKHEFIGTKSFGQEKNCCLKCGKTKEAHEESVCYTPIITIYFNGKLWKFNDWKEARQHGFYLY